MYCIPSERAKRGQPFLELREVKQKDGEKTRGGRSRWFFCTFGTHLVPFPRESSIIHERRRYLRNRAKQQNNAKILFTAGMLDGL